MINDYDIENLKNILYDNLGDWYTADLLRFLNRAIAKADVENRNILLRAWPAECITIYRYWGWKDTDINKLMPGVIKSAPELSPINRYENES